MHQSDEESMKEVCWTRTPAMGGVDELTGQIVTEEPQE